MASARHNKYPVVDSSKFGRLRPARFARVDAFDSVISDDGLSLADWQRLPTSSRTNKANRECDDRGQGGDGHRLSVGHQRGPFFTSSFQEAVSPGNSSASD